MSTVFLWIGVLYICVVGVGAKMRRFCEGVGGITGRGGVGVGGMGVRDGCAGLIGSETWKLGG